MKLGIIGPPQSGKTTIFNAVSGLQETVGDFSRTVHRAVIKVPDERLDNLAELIKPRKVTHTSIEFLDAACFTGRGKKSTGELEGIHDLRLMDAVAVVVDDFSPEARTEQDIGNIIDEMILADLIMIEDNVGKLERSIKLTGKKDRAFELETLKKCRDILNDNKLISEIGLADDELKSIRGYAFLTLLPQLLVFNISEDKLDRHADIYAGYEKYRREGITDISVICGKIEMELAALDDDDQKEFLAELNIEKPFVEKLIQRSYRLLGLISFFTLSEPECRAWTIPEGATAVTAAGAVHSDFARGFIRAEVASYEDYMEYKTPAALKAAARLNVEGKDYVVRDGDVIQFLFNV